MKEKITFQIILIITIICCCFAIKYCNENKNANEVKKSITYNVTGYHHEPAGYKRSAHRYVFLHNDKYGDFTFEVSPKTFYDAKQGQKTMTFTDTFADLMYSADNERTKENLMKYKEDFNVKEYSNSQITESLVWTWYIAFPFIALFTLPLMLILSESESMSIVPMEYYLSVGVWVISSLIMVIIHLI